MALPVRLSLRKLEFMAPHGNVQLAALYREESGLRTADRLDSGKLLMVGDVFKNALDAGLTGALPSHEPEYCFNYGYY
jgi:hypothetical protein